MIINVCLYCQFCRFILTQSIQLYDLLQLTQYNNMENWLSDIDTPTEGVICSDLKTVRLLLNQFSLLLTPLTDRDTDSLLVAQVDDDIKGNIDSLNELYKILLSRLNLSMSNVYQSTFSFKSFKTLMFLPQNCQDQIDQDMQKRRRRYITRQKHRGPYRSYTSQEKNHVVSLHKKGMTFASISKELEIPQKNVVRWCREGFAGKEDNKRLADAQMQRRLSNWLIQNHKKNPVSYSQIQAKALLLASNPQFKASRGWLKNFLKRFDPKNQILQLKINE